MRVLPLHSPEPRCRHHTRLVGWGGVTDSLSLRKYCGGFRGNDNLQPLLSPLSCWTLGRRDTMPQCARIYPQGEACAPLVVKSTSNDLSRKKGLLHLVGQQKRARSTGMPKTHIDTSSSTWGVQPVPSNVCKPSLVPCNFLHYLLKYLLVK